MRWTPHSRRRARTKSATSSFTKTRFPQRSPRKRVDHRLRDHAHRTAGRLARLAEPRERRILGKPALLHEQAFRALDRLARGERIGERIHLLAYLRQLAEAGLGG